MQIKIQLNEYSSLETVDGCPDEVEIIFHDGDVSVREVFNISDLQFALRKISAI